MKSTSLERLGKNNGVWASRESSGLINLPLALITTLTKCKSRSLIVFLTSIVKLILDESKLNCVMSEDIIYIGI